MHDADADTSAGADAGEYAGVDAGDDAGDSDDKDGDDADGTHLQNYCNKLQLNILKIMLPVPIL